MTFMNIKPGWAIAYGMSALALIIPGFGYLFFTDNLILSNNLILVLASILFSYPLYLLSCILSARIRQKIIHEQALAITAGYALASFFVTTFLFYVFNQRLHFLLLMYAGGPIVIVILRYIEKLLGT